MFLGVVSPGSLVVRLLQSCYLQILDFHMKTTGCTSLANYSSLVGNVWTSPDRADAFTAVPPVPDTIDNLSMGRCFERGLQSLLPLEFLIGTSSLGNHDRYIIIGTLSLEHSQLRVHALLAVLFWLLLLLLDKV